MNRIISEEAYKNALAMATAISEGKHHDTVAGSVVLGQLRNAPLATALDLSVEWLERFWQDNGGWTMAENTKCFEALVKHIASLQPPSGQVGEELVHLVRFLANYQRELCEIRAKAMRMLSLGDSEGARDLLVLNWPIVQGSQNQWDLETIGKQPFDMAKMRPAIRAMLDGSAIRQPVETVGGVEHYRKVLQDIKKWANSGWTDKWQSVLSGKITRALNQGEALRTQPQAQASETATMVKSATGELLKLGIQALRETQAPVHPLIGMEIPETLSPGPWTDGSQPRAPVSGYGYGGSNVTSVWMDRPITLLSGQPQAPVVEVCHCGMTPEDHGFETHTFTPMEQPSVVEVLTRQELQGLKVHTFEVPRSEGSESETVEREFYSVPEVHALLQSKGGR